PTQAPEFNNWSVTNTHGEKRDVTVVWQLPPLITWNGVPNRFNIDYWKTTKQNDSSVPIPNSTKSLQINDSSATEATLRGLNRYVEYQTQISMCTAEGCGPKSVPWPLEGEEAGENEPHVDSLSLDSPLIWIVLVVLPPLITWNGVPNRFNIDYWKTTKQNDSSVPIPNSIKSLQINDSSATEATLRGLNRYVEYQAQISMCTAEGCGPKSVPWPLEGEEAGENEPYVDSLSLDSWLIWIVLATTTTIAAKNTEPLYGDLENSASTSENSYYDRIHSHGDLTDPQLIIQDG
ncbi:hypothetical protein pdam_00016627, partial [Pocillopora damicornis]